MKFRTILVICFLLPAIPISLMADDEVPSISPRIGSLPAGRVLFLGNSITLHGPAPEIGWTGNWGMAASAEHLDYVHLVTAGIAAASGLEPEIMVSNIATLGLDESNMARSERQIEHAGVAGHPGDKGMKAIADAILAAIKTRAGQDNSCTQLIGYTELKTNLPGGRHANVRTMRAHVLSADGSANREVAGELINEPDCWTQFAGWSPDGTTAVIARGWQSPDNAAIEEDKKRFTLQRKAGSLIRKDNYFAFRRLCGYVATLAASPAKPLVGPTYELLEKHDAARLNTTSDSSPRHGAAGRSNERIFGRIFVFFVAILHGLPTMPNPFVLLRQRRRVIGVCRCTHPSRRSTKQTNRHKKHKEAQGTRGITGQYVVFQAGFAVRC